MKIESIRFFPSCKKHLYRFKYRCLIGVGGNEGDVKKRFVALYRFLMRDRRFRLIQTSPAFQNPPFGYVEQNDFYNAVMVIETSLYANALLKVLLHIEKCFKRQRSFKNAPRTLDLDIIFFDNLRQKQKHLTLPHPHWEKRLSVVVPFVMLKRCKG